MNYPETLQRARQISDAIMEDSAEQSHRHAFTRDEMLRRLAEHPDFGALLALLVQHESEFATSAARQDLANHSGCLQHCAGSIYGVQQIRAQLKQIIHEAPVKAARRRGGMAASEESPER